MRPKNIALRIYNLKFDTQTCSYPEKQQVAGFNAKIMFWEYVFCLSGYPFGVFAWIRKPKIVNSSARAMMVSLKTACKKKLFPSAF